MAVVVVRAVSVVAGMFVLVAVVELVSLPGVVVRVGVLAVAEPGSDLTVHR